MTENLRQQLQPLTAVPFATAETFFGTSASELARAG
jgi:hypothetical protein